MGSIANGMALHGGIIPYTATFLIFSDYMRPPIRLTALMDLRLGYIFTHDSIGLGEDGQTHQPIEQLLSRESIAWASPCMRMRVREVSSNPSVLIRAKATSRSNSVSWARWTLFWPPSPMNSLTW